MKISPINILLRAELLCAKVDVHARPGCEAGPLFKTLDACVAPVIMTSIAATMSISSQAPQHELMLILLFYKTFTSCDRRSWLATLTTFELASTSASKSDKSRSRLQVDEKRRRGMH